LGLVDCGFYDSIIGSIDSGTLLEFPDNRIEFSFQILILLREVYSMRRGGLRPLDGASWLRYHVSFVRLMSVDHWLEQFTGPSHGARECQLR
jgi:hypothetical protein